MAFKGKGTDSGVKKCLPTSKFPLFFLLLGFSHLSVSEHQIFGMA